VVAIKVNPGAVVVSADPIRPGDKRDLAVILSSGRGKKTPLSEYPLKGRAIRGVTAVGLPASPKGTHVAFAGVVGAGDSVFVTTTAGRALVLAADEIKRQGRATGGVITVGLSSAKDAAEEVANGAVAVGQ
jgi:DNA gyrase subunit A